jgi:RHS repeat-associated protein
LGITISLTSYAYDSFGRLMSESELVDNPFGFTGAERDVESGLYYMRARYYDPFSGRFVQADGRGFTTGLTAGKLADPYGGKLVIIWAKPSSKKPRTR